MATTKTQQEQLRQALPVPSRPVFRPRQRDFSGNPTKPVASQSDDHWRDERNSERRPTGQRSFADSRPPRTPVPKRTSFTKPGAFAKTPVSTKPVGTRNKGKEKAKSQSRQILNPNDPKFMTPEEIAAARNKFAVLGSDDEDQDEEEQRHAVQHRAQAAASAQGDARPSTAAKKEGHGHTHAKTNTNQGGGNRPLNPAHYREAYVKPDTSEYQHMVFSGKSVFYDAGDVDGEKELEFEISDDGITVFYEESDTDGPRELVYKVPSHQTNIFIEDVPQTVPKQSTLQKRYTPINPKALEPEEEELLHLGKLVDEGFLALDDYMNRQRELVALMNARLQMSRQRQQLLDQEEQEQRRKMEQTRLQYQKEKGAQVRKPKAPEATSTNGTPKSKTTSAGTNNQATTSKAKAGKKVAPPKKKSSGDPVLDRIRNFVNNDEVAALIYKDLKTSRDSGVPKRKQLYFPDDQKRSLLRKGKTREVALTSPTPTTEGATNRDKLDAVSDVIYILKLSGRDPIKTMSSKKSLDVSDIVPTPEVMHHVEHVATTNPALVKGLVTHVKIERRMRESYQHKLVASRPSKQACGF